MNRLREKKNYWIGGSVAAFSGVAFVKLVAPALSGTWQQALQVVGYALVFAGFGIIACATRRRDEEALIVAPENQKDKPTRFRRMP